MWIIRNRETGTMSNEFETLEDAQKALKYLQSKNKKKGIEKFYMLIERSPNHGILGTLKIELPNACINQDCVWNTVHYGYIQKNGCHMLKDISKCVNGEKSGFTSIYELKKKN